MRHGPFKYADAAPPKTYACGNCGASGCKLWREYQTMNTRLLCGRCALADQKKSATIDERGTVKDEHCGKTDQIGWWVPAVPDEEGQGYWGYTSVPESGCAWWRALPSYPAATP